MVNQTIDRRRRGHGILEDTLPLRESQVARDQHASTLVALRQQSEQNLHLFAALLDITQVVDEQSVVAAQALEQASQRQIALGDEQFLNQQVAGRVEHTPTLAHQILAQRTQKVGFAAPRIAEGQHILPTIQERSFPQRRKSAAEDASASASSRKSRSFSAPEDATPKAAAPGDAANVSRLRAPADPEGTRRNSILLGLPAHRPPPHRRARWAGTTL